jgi:hypothetical protein
MKLRSDYHDFDESTWIEQQIHRYGPMIGGVELRQFLGFRTSSAFLKARSLGPIGLATFGLPGRQGQFALTAEACAWVIEQRKLAESSEPASNQDAKSGGGQ